MSQYDKDIVDPLAIDPGPTGGIALATLIGAFVEAIQTGNKGSTEPEYKIVGLEWIDDTGTPWILKRYDGTDWIEIGTINPTTNKFSARRRPRTATAASASSVTPDSDAYDSYVYSALAANLAFGAPTGTPDDLQDLVFRLKDNGSARTLTFNSAFRASSDLALPTATEANEALYLGFKWNATDSKWDLVAKLGNFT